MPKISKHSIQKVRNISSRMDEDDDDDTDHQVTPRKTRPISRKQQRKTDRKLKKVKKNAWYTHQTVSEVLPRKYQVKTEKPRPEKTTSRKRKTPDEAEDMSEKRVAQIKEKRRLQLVEKLKEENEQEDKLINQLEKKLKLRKRRSKALPSSFVDEGLDYLLEVLENPKSEMDLSDPETDPVELEGNEISMNEDDEAPLEITSKKNALGNKSKGILKQTKLPHPVKETQMEGDLDISDEDDFPGENNADEHDEEYSDEEHTDEEFADADDKEDSGSLQEEHADEEDDVSDAQSTGEDQKEGSAKNSHAKPSEGVEEGGDGVWEDIYGRFRDKKGNVVSGNVTAKYVPPGLKSATGGDEKMERLSRQLKGLLNRLTETNMANIVAQVEDLYRAHSRHDMNSTLVKLILNSCVQPGMMPKRLALEHGMFLGLLYQNIGQETGAFFIEQLIALYDELVADMSSRSVGELDKRLDNVILLWCHLLNFKIIHSAMVFDLLDEFTERFLEKDVDMILIILREVGFALRKSDPAALKDCLVKIQTRANEMLTAQPASRSRFNFMLDILTAIRNNNMRKIPNYDPSELEHLTKVFRALIRKGHTVEAELKIALKDLRSAKERGKWWVVGAAWQQPELAPMEKRSTGSEGVASAVGAEKNARLLELAGKQRMNTDVRKAVFCAVMGAEDFNDAFERIAKLNLKNAQEAEIIHVLIHCTLNEKEFNPYYALVIDKFCGSHRTYQRQLLFALWDKIRDLSTLNPTHQTNLAELLSHGLIHSTLPITVLKKTNFADMNTPLVELLRNVLSSLLLAPSEKDMTEIFSTLAEKKYKILRESLRLFMRHFMMRNAGKVLTGKFAKVSKDDLMKRIDLAEKALLGTNRL